MTEFGIWVRHDGLSFHEISRIVLAAESLGFDSVWFFDHFCPFEDETIVETPLLECWSILSALASITKRIRLGTLVLCNSYRYPSLLAKMAASLDNISGGRLEFGIGAGWRRPEYIAYGIPFPRLSERVEQLKEALQIIKMMWTLKEPSFKGEYYNIKKATMFPKPLQKPHPPIMIGGHGKEVLKVTAEFADKCDIGYWETTEGFQRKLNILNNYCEQIGRDFNKITKCWHTQVVIAEDGKEVKDKMLKIKGSHRNTAIREMPVEEYKARCVVGTPEECAKRLEQYIDVGASYFILHFPDMLKIKPLEVFAEHVMPTIKNSNL